MQATRYATGFKKEATAQVRDLAPNLHKRPTDELRDPPSAVKARNTFTGAQTSGLLSRVVVPVRSKPINHGHKEAFDFASRPSILGQVSVPRRAQAGPLSEKKRAVLGGPGLFDLLTQPPRARPVVPKAEAAPVVSGTKKETRTENALIAFDLESGALIKGIDEKIDKVSNLDPSFRKDAESVIQALVSIKKDVETKQLSYRKELEERTSQIEKVKESSRVLDEEITKISSEMNSAVSLTQEQTRAFVIRWNDLVAKKDKASVEIIQRSLDLYAASEKAVSDIEAFKKQTLRTESGVTLSDRESVLKNLILSSTDAVTINQVISLLKQTDRLNAELNQLKLDTSKSGNVNQEAIRLARLDEQTKFNEAATRYISTIDALKKRVEEAQKSTTDAEAEHAKQIQELKANFETENGLLQQEINRQTDEAEKLKRELDTAKNDLLKATINHGNTTKTSSEAQTAINALQAALETERNENAKLKAQVDGFGERLRVEKETAVAAEVKRQGDNVEVLEKKATANYLALKEENEAAVAAATTAEAQRQAQRIKDLEERILKAQRVSEEKLESDKKKNEGETKTLLEQISALEDNLKKLRKKSLDSEKKSNQTIGQLTQKIQENETKARAQATEIAKYINTAAENQAKIKVFQKQITEAGLLVKTQAQAYQESIAAANQRGSEHEEKAKAAQLTLIEAQNDINRLKLQIKATEGETLNATERANETFRADKNILLGLLSAAETSNEALKAKNSSQAAEIVKLASTINAEKTAAKLQDELRLKEIEGLNKDVKKVKGLRLKLGRLDAENSKLGAEIITIRIAHQEIQTQQAKSLKERYEISEARNKSAEDMQKSIDSGNERLKVVQGKLLNAQHALGQAQKTHLEREKELEKKSATDLEALHQRVKDLEASNQDFVQENAKIFATHFGFVTANNNLAAANERFDEANLAFADENRRLEAEVESLQEEIAEYKGHTKGHIKRAEEALADYKK